MHVRAFASLCLLVVMQVRVQDICTMEDVLGVKLRVMVRYTEPPLIAEGETKSPQQLLRVSAGSFVLRQT